jgi:hypothetical protein
MGEVCGGVVAGWRKIHSFGSAVGVKSDESFCQKQKSYGAKKQTFILFYQ